MLDSAWVLARFEILECSDPPPIKQNTISLRFRSRLAASRTVSSGWHGLWFPEYITTNLPANVCSRRNDLRPSGSWRTAASCDHGGIVDIFSAATPFATS